MTKKRIGVPIFALLVLAISLPLLIYAQSGSPVDLSGWGWSSYVGWIKASDSNYGVSIIRIDGLDYLSGYAWSSSVGWIRFKPEYSGPDCSVGCEPKHGARLGPADSNDVQPVTGWARICSVFASGCSDGLKDNIKRGGWEGWVKMINVTVRPKTGANGEFLQFGGYAWSDLNTGWIKLDPFTANSNGCQGICTGGGGNVFSASCDVTSTTVNPPTATYAVTIDNGTGPYDITYGASPKDEETKTTNSNTYLLTRNYDNIGPQAGFDVSVVDKGVNPNKEVTTTCPEADITETIGCGPANKGRYCTSNGVSGVTDSFCPEGTDVVPDEKENEDPPVGGHSYYWKCVSGSSKSSQCSLTWDDSLCSSPFKFTPDCPTPIQKVRLGGKDYCPVIVDHPPATAPATSTKVSIGMTTGAGSTSFSSDGVKNIPLSASGFGSPRAIFGEGGSSASVDTGEAFDFSILFPDRGTTDTCVSSPYRTAGRVIRLRQDGWNICSEDTEGVAPAFPNPDESDCPAVALVYTDPRSCSI